MTSDSALQSDPMNEQGSVADAMGASWLSAQAIQSQGAVYTPAGLAHYVARRLLEYSLVDQNDAERLARKVAVDPACGDGGLLQAIRAEANLLGVEVDLVGTDIDGQAIAAADRRLGRDGRTALVTANALIPSPTESAEQGWIRLLRRLDLPEKPDLLIANPPWGAALEFDRASLASAGFHLARGQFDSSDLFVELACSLVRRGGFIGLIIPDSIFAIEHKELREILLTRVRLLHVARLGEGMFDGVFRGCVVVIAKNEAPQAGQFTTCMRLNGAWRQRVLRQEVDLATAEVALSHQVETERFRSNNNFVIDIDASSLDVPTLSKLSRTGSRVSTYLDSSRGVELSKNGQTVHCSECRNWSPRPKVMGRCPACGQSKSVLREECLVSPTAKPNFVPFIVGEDVGRHRIFSRRWLAAGKPGINYKEASLYAGPKLLVRKTGVGISAAVDYSDAYTNQVVYVFKQHVGLPAWVPIEFAAAIIGSRAVYFHLVKTHGETEWRSHPYVTQQDILDLPAPSLRRVEENWKEVLETEEILRTSPTPMGVTNHEDARLERIVANCFGLVRSDYERIFETLNELQSLLPVRALKNIGVDDIFG